MICDGYSNCHKSEVITEDNSAVWVLCTECDAQERIGKDKNGNPEHRAYGDWFMRDFLQPPSVLYYRYYPQGMNIV